MILIDTDVLIAHLRGVESAREWLMEASSRQELVISVLTITEIAGGMRSHERPQVWRLLTSLRSEPVTYAIARRAGELRRTWYRSHTGIATIDYLIAATAIEIGCDLATLNTRHYPMLPELKPAFAL